MRICTSISFYAELPFGKSSYILLLIFKVLDVVSWHCKLFLKVILKDSLNY